jgi:hypothetical protein
MLGLLARRHRWPLTDVSITFITPDDLLDRVAPPNVATMDLLGWFQFHTRHYRPHRAFFRSLFQPLPEIRQVLISAWARLRQRGNTVVGVHLRRGDRLNIPLNTNEWVAPARLYTEWLERIWPSLDRPVLFLASDSI